MTQPDWMDGFRQDLPVPLVWRPGQTSLSIEVICCPRCSSVQVCPRDNHISETLMRWECTHCRFSFKLPRRAPIKAYVNGL